MIETAWWLQYLQSMLVTISILSPKLFSIYVSDVAKFNYIGITTCGSYLWALTFESLSDLVGMVLADLSPRKIMRIHNSECHTFLQAGYIVFIYQKILLTWSCLSKYGNFNGTLYWQSMNDLQNYILPYQFYRLLLRFGKDKWGILLFGHLSLCDGFGLCTRTHPAVSHSRLHWLSWCLWRLTLQAIARALTQSFVGSIKAAGWLNTRSCVFGTKIKLK